MCQCGYNFVPDATEVIAIRSGQIGNPERAGDDADAQCDEPNTTGHVYQLEKAVVVRSELHSCER